jgi:L-seryl-tRNA(Ser) seleniumtransferase
MANRRTFLQSLSSLPLVGGLFASTSAAAAATGGRDYFKELGVKPFINAAGTYTMLTSSLMGRDVVQAYDYASRSFVKLNDVQDAVGRRPWLPLEPLVRSPAERRLASRARIKRRFCRFPILRA